MDGYGHMSPEPTVVVNEPDMPMWAVRLEGKVDLVVSQQTARLDNHGSKIDDHEVRLRGLERDMPHDAHDRLRGVEERKTVSPAQLWTAVASGAGALASIAAVVNLIAK